MTCRQRLIDLFDAHGVPYQFQEHRPTYTAQEEASAEHLPGRRVAKPVIAFANERPIMVVVPADRQVNLGALALATGRTVRLALPAHPTGWAGEPSRWVW